MTTTGVTRRRWWRWGCEGTRGAVAAAAVAVRDDEEGGDDVVVEILAVMVEVLEGDELVEMASGVEMVMETNDGDGDEEWVTTTEMVATEMIGGGERWRRRRRWGMVAVEMEMVEDGDEWWR